MKKIVSRLAVVILAGFFAVNSYAQNGEKCDGRQQGKNVHRGGKFKGIGRKLMHGLKLDDEQREKVKAVREKYKAQLENAEKAAEEARKAFRIASANPDSDESTLKALASAVGEKMFAKVQVRRQMIEEIKSILTDEQKSTLKENLKKMAERTREKCERERKRHSRKGGKGHKGRKGKGRNREGKAGDDSEDND
jgi:Spy/CpxP family protein refolding chaperone